MLFCIHQSNSPRVIFEKPLSIVSILTESTALYLLKEKWHALDKVRSVKLGTTEQEHLTQKQKEHDEKVFK
ncbi:hypothetical protein B9J76_05730 [Lacticaseibacillus paracasei]|nr:hypothetical protein Lpp17_2855 [Lacticaseibacillus paracasei subsp. paracasei Lpp17]OSP84915.1 hypothetical protein B9J76_05730 [Lacticaseibacillus paracasei]